MDADFGGDDEEEGEKQESDDEATRIADDPEQKKMRDEAEAQSQEITRDSVRKCYKCAAEFVLGTVICIECGADLGLEHLSPEERASWEEEAVRTASSLNLSITPKAVKGRTVESTVRLAMKKQWNNAVKDRGFKSFADRYWNDSDNDFQFQRRCQENGRGPYWCDPYLKELREGLVPEHRLKKAEEFLKGRRAQAILSDLPIPPSGKRNPRPMDPALIQRVLAFKKKTELASEENREIRPTELDDIKMFGGRSDHEVWSYSQRHGWRQVNELYDPTAVPATSPSVQAATPDRPSTPAPEVTRYNWNYWNDADWTADTAQHWQWQSEAWEEDNSGSSWSASGSWSSNSWRR
jgi:hypothetical protein